MILPSFGPIGVEEPPPNTLRKMPHEGVVSESMALSCISILSAHHAVRTDAQTISDAIRTDDDSLPISKLIELLGDFGLTARYFLGDWLWLQMEVSYHPTLLVLKNKNVVVAVANGSSGTEEMVIRDPLHRDAETIVLSREDIERAWDGDLLIITPQPERSENSDAECNREEFDLSQPLRSVQPQLSENPLKSNDRRSGRMSRRLRVAVLSCLLAALLFAPSSGTFDKWVPEKVPQPALPSGELAAHLESSSSNPTTPAYQAVENTSENPSSSGGRPQSETPAKKAVSAAENQSTAPELTTAQPPQAEQKGMSSTPTLTAEKSAALLARGDDYLRVGDFASARLFYERVADAGWANAALRLGETFDPVFLERAQIHGIAGDMEKAMFWYRRARDLGSVEAGMLLKQLDAN